MKIINKQKKGFLLAEETLKIILAVIAISFLAYFLFSLYRANNDAKNLDLAKESLNFLFREINTQKTEVDIYNPEGWSILSWPFEDKRPLSCSNLGWNSCICFCKNPWIKTSGNYLDNCEDTTKSICKESSLIVMRSAEKQLPINIDNPPIKLIIDYQNKKISRM